MTGGCKGVCKRYMPTDPGSATRYSNGQKRCQMCEMFLIWDGLRCPCCNCRLRTKPRSSKYKEKMRVSKPASVMNQEKKMKKKGIKQDVL